MSLQNIFPVFHLLKTLMLLKRELKLSYKRWTIQNLFPAKQVLKEKAIKFSCQRCPLSLVITKTSSHPTPKPLSNQHEVKESRVIEVHSTKEQVISTKEQVHCIEQRGKNDESSLLDFSSSKQQLPNDSRLAMTGRWETDPVLDTGSNTLSMFQQIGTPTFTMTHSATAQVLDTNCTRRIP